MTRRICLATTLVVLGSCAVDQETDVGPAAVVDADWIENHYNKAEYRVPVRDGVHLFTTVYTPKDTSREYPMLMKRTPYSVRPYGEGKFPGKLGPAKEYVRDGYIFVYQDVRGKYMSEGEFVNMTPHVPHKSAPSDVDESSDTYDTIEWLLENVEGHNGRVGLYGISYPGFYAAAGMIDHHPALVAVSPQAPIADWWFDDFHHHGAFFLPHTFGFISSFGQPRPEPSTEGGKRPFEYPTKDGYDFYLNHIGPLSTLNGPEYLDGGVAFWNSTIEHPNYDEFWQKRDILPHLDNVPPAVLTVGGWFDAEDLYGSLQIYRSVEAKNPNVWNGIIMGPWRHGGWSRTDGSMLGNITFGAPTSEFYLAEIEKPFFDAHLKGDGSVDIAEATMFETGANEWREFDEWPPAASEESAFYLGDDGALLMAPESEPGEPYDAFVSDPAKPVPFTQDVTLRMTREYMTDDQRFAGRRPDVLVFQTPVLDEPVTLAGPIVADLWVSTTAADADWIVKLIDVFPDDAADHDGLRDGVHMSGYQMMVRSEVLRGRFRDSHEHPRPFEPNTATRVRVPMQDVLHTFEPGHRIMIQIQSTWFPLIDRNPQGWVDNIYKAEADDYIAATHRVHHDGEHASRIEVRILPAE